MSSLIDIVLHWVHEFFGGAKVSDLSELGADPHDVAPQVTGPGAGAHFQNLDALNASDSIRTSVAASQQHLLDSNAAHDAIVNADQASIHADSVNEAAETALDQAEEATGTSS
jgi:hypothetical protein